MKRKTYSISPAKIGNEDGFRLPRAFSQENPHLVQSYGQIEVISEDILLIRLDPTKREQEEEEESLMMSLFLDFLMKDAIKNPDRLVPYTEEMNREIDDLLADVEVQNE
jgi:antitoxin PrlF